MAIYDGTEGEILTEIEFDVAIDSPDCQNLRMIVHSTLIHLCAGDVGNAH